MAEPDPRVAVGVVGSFAASGCFQPLRSRSLVAACHQLAFSRMPKRFWAAPDGSVPGSAIWGQTPPGGARPQMATFDNSVAVLELDERRAQLTIRRSAGCTSGDLTRNV